MPKISIIVSSFNRLDLLRTCLASLRETVPAGPAVEWIVVDDASTDGTREWLASHRRDDWQVLQNETNLGYAASNNRAAEQARGESLVFINGDLILRPRWLEPMLDLLESQPEAFAVGNRQRAVKDGRLDHAGMTFLPTGTPIHVRDESIAFDEFPAVTFACAAVRSERFLALGGFDASYRNGLEDVDLCLRSRARGWTCHVAHASVMEHHISASPGRKDAEVENERSFQRRWNKFTVQWARDWNERTIRNRVGRRLATTSATNRTQKPVRVLVDCSPLHESDAFERLLRVLDETAKLTLQENQQSPGAIPRRAPEVQPYDQTPRQFEFHVLLGSSSFGVWRLGAAFKSGSKLPHSKEQPPTGESKTVRNSEAPTTFWMLPGTEEPANEDFRFRRLTDVGSTLARDLQADLLYLPFGETPHICPDIPIVSAVDAIGEGDADTIESVDRLARVSFMIECRSAQVAERLQKDFLRSADSVFVATSGDDAARELAKTFQDALKAFADGSVAWHWDPTVDAAAELPADRDVRPDEVLLQVDEPTRWDNPVPLLQIRGWCLSNTPSPVATVFVRSVNGTWEGVYGLSRPDVAAAFPERDGAATAGFVLRLPRPTEVPSEISIEIQFADGERVTVLRPVIGARSAPSSKAEGAFKGRTKED